MNKSKGIRPILFIACFTFGIALFLIYAFTTTITTSDPAPDSSTLSVVEVSHFNSGTYSDKRNELLMEADNNDLYAASRGAKDRYSDNKVSQTENKPETPAAPTKTTAAKTAAPAKAFSNIPAKAVQSTAAKAAAEKTDDLDLLARLITAEAQGEPYEAKVAVGAVVMNRVKSSSWPNTIKEVIYQKISGYIQFTPVENGWIDKPAEPESVKAAQAALSGADPTNGAQFYYDDTTTNTWILAKPVSTQIGHMIFAF